MDAITTVTVTIGRNIGSEPMDSDRWEAFQEDIRTILGQGVGRESSWIETHYGVGEWDGVREESAKITILDADKSHMIGVHAPLRQVCETYGQDAVALATGLSILVAPIAARV